MKEDFEGYLFHQGTNFNAYEYLGAHLKKVKGKKGVLFRVWAPNAKGVSVVGNFNNWDVNASKMHLIDNNGVWEAFIENLTTFTNYTYAIKTTQNKY